MSNRVINLAKRLESNGESSPAPKPADTPEVDDTTLVEGAKRKERWALDTLIHRYQAKAFAIAYRMTSGDEEKARDLTQEAFIKVIGSIKKFKGKSSFYTWLYRIVVNTCLDARRKEQRWRKIFKFGSASPTNEASFDRDLEAHSDNNPMSDPMANLTSKELKREIQAALAQLSDHQRMVFTLKVFEGFSIAEIANLMNTAKGTVKSHLFRATRHMRKTLGHWTIS